LEDAGFNRLKTLAPFWDRNGGAVRLIWEKYISSPIGKFIGVLLVVLGLLEWLFPNAKMIFSTWAKTFFQ